jgi:signal transduction histidine kinase
MISVYGRCDSPPGTESVLQIDAAVSIPPDLPLHSATEICISPFLTPFAGVGWTMILWVSYLSVLSIIDTVDSVSIVIVAVLLLLCIAYLLCERARLSRLTQELMGQNLSILRDIEESKQAEEYLRLSRERFFNEHRKAEMALEQLTARLLQLQDEERRRIARELHDVTAQNMLAIVTNLSRLKQGRFLPSEFNDILSDCYQLGKESLKDIRTFSYLLHPPMLDESGLSDALQWYVDGFITRSGIYVDLALPPEVERLPSEVEIALFRVVQESLTNIHRHSGSDSASIRLEREPTQLALRITDSGHGMAGTIKSKETDEALLLGVGIPGMRQRIRQLGGVLEIRSSEQGTTVKVTLPLANTSEAVGSKAGG